MVTVCKDGKFSAHRLLFLLDTAASVPGWRFSRTPGIREIPTAFRGESREVDEARGDSPKYAPRLK